MTESIEHAFMREDAIGERQFLDDLGHLIGHDLPLLWLACGRGGVIANPDLHATYSMTIRAPVAPFKSRLR